VGTQHGNLHQLSVTINRVTYFILRATQVPVLATANTGKNPERLWENTGEWAGRVEISKEEIPGSKRGMIVWLYTDLLQALKENLSALCSQQMGLISASQAPNCRNSMQQK